MDKLGADFYMSVESIAARITDKAVVLQLPVGQADEFEAIVDLLTMKMYTYSGDHGIDTHENDIPADMMDKVKKYKEEMLDKLSLFDDELAEKFLAGEEIDISIIKRAIRNGTIHNNLYPVLCGSALGNKGVQQMLDAVIDYLPCPLDRGVMKGIDPDDETKILERKPNDQEPVSAIAFKIATDPFVGTLTFVRVYSGIIKSGDTLLNPLTRQKERVGRLLLMHANKREEIDEIHAGHICAFL